LIRFNPRVDDGAAARTYVHAMNRYLITAAAAVVISALFWIDPLFVPLVLLGPIVTGFAAGRRGIAREAAAAWFAAGLLALLSDWAINNEDQLFHLVLALWTAGVTLAVAALHSRADALRNRIPRVHRQATRP
jgi:peptidoglycan/LPS O-acetylase OafA/YrhL